MVASDRLSAFDVVLAEPIPDKGRVLTAMTVHWLEVLADLAPSHLMSADPVVPRGSRRAGRRRGPGRHGGPGHARAQGRHAADRVHRRTATWPARGGRSTPPRARCTARPCRPGSSRRTGSPSPSSRPPPRRPRATTSTSPSTRPPSRRQGGGREGRATSVSRPIAAGAAAAERNGIIVADTKFELGLIDGELAPCDEVLTPDSSRFWPADQWRPGTNPPAFAARARPARGERMEQEAPAPSPVARGREGDERALHRRLRADQRAASGRLVRCRKVRRA